MGDSVTPHNHVFVKELVGYLKAANAYQLFDESGRKIGEVKEEVPGFFRKLLKFTGYKTMLPFTVHFYDENNQVFLTINRKFTFFQSKVNVFEQNQKHLGYFKQKMFSLGGRFVVIDPDEQPIGEVKGDWKGWDFTVFDQHQQPVGKITKKWAGIGKEFFTSADNYIITQDPQTMKNPEMRKLVLAAGICIDMVLKEQGR